jgi:MFS transporter, PCFT/HCP family, solute carrier family 46, member 3
MFFLLLLAGMFFYTFQRDEKPMLFLYTQLIFNWNADDYSYFKTFQSTAYVITMLLGIPFMAKVLKMNDTGIIIAGAMAHAVSRLFFGFAQVWWIIYVGAFFASLGPVVGPVLRSMISKTVPLSERGIAFALLSVCDNAVPLFSGVLYTQVYNASIHTHPAAIFWLTIGTQILVMSFIG